jgi:hypothetical protein
MLLVQASYAQTNLTKNEDNADKLTITAKYQFTEFGDLPHIVFEDTNGKIWDFGEGDHDFKGYDFGQIEDFKTNEALVDKEFKIELVKGKMKTYADDFETVIEVDTYLIVNIQRIP